MKVPPSANPFEIDRVNGPLDFRPEWDVESLNNNVSIWLENQIKQLAGSKQVDPKLKIPVLKSPSGYGKTHLFARISHSLGHEVLVFFVPQFRDIHRPLEHIRWHVVENLFASRGPEPSILERILTRLCLPSFKDYFRNQLPTVVSRCQSVVDGLEADKSESLLTVIGQVHELEPFLKLAKSVAQRNTQLDGNIVRALLMGWAPTEYSNTARRWLRGDTPPEEDLDPLSLPSEQPDAIKVLEAVVALLRYEVPVVIFCDQIEAVLVDIEKGPLEVSSRLTDVLQSVPALMVVLSCLKDKWEDFQDHAFGMFRTRVLPIDLAAMQPLEACDLLRRRLLTWAGYRPDKPDTWPFEKESIIEHVSSSAASTNPRWFILKCKEAFEDWDGISTIAIEDSVVKPAELTDLFVQRWNSELQAVSSKPDRSPEDHPEDWLYTAVKESVSLVATPEWSVDGVRITSPVEDALASTQAQKRRSLKIDVKSNGQHTPVIVAVTNLDNAYQFRFYFEALDAAIDQQSACCLVLHPRSSDPKMGSGTFKKFSELKNKGRIRSFGFADDTPTFNQLECLMKILDLANGDELELGGRQLSADDCRDLIIKTGVLDDLELFKSLSQDWPAIEAVQEKTVPGPEPEPALVGAAAESQIQSDETGATKEATGKQAAPGQPVPLSTGDDKSDAEVWTRAQLQQVTEKLKLWRLPVEPDGYDIGPTFARLKVRPQGATTVARIRNKNEDLKIHLELEERPIIGSQAGHISIDVQLPKRRTVTIAEALANNPPDEEQGEPFFPVGVDVTGKAHWLNLADPADCHLLVGGITGSGKSEFLKALVGGLASRLGPDQVQFVLIDPKKVTFNFGGAESPYFLRDIAYDIEAALPLVKDCFDEVERRFDLLQQRQMDNVSQLTDKEALPQIVMIIDEFADLMVEKTSKQALEKPLKRIGGKARAAGVHLVLATQRPDKDVVTPLLRTNLPGRISLKVATAADSKIILDEQGAEFLLGRGDLFWKRGGNLRRMQSPYVERDQLVELLRMA